MKFRLSRHAKQELQRRAIPLELLESVLKNPQQVVEQADEKTVYQSQIDFGGKIFLLRAIVVEDIKPPVVVTVYRTRKIRKYWRQP